MPPFLAHGVDVLLIRWLASQVRPPDGPLPRAGGVPDSPDAIARPGPILPSFRPGPKEGVWSFDAPSPVAAPCEECRTIHGQALGPADASSALIVLHGAYGEYINCELMGREFVKHGYRVLIPAAPYHLERAPHGVHSGAAFFWSTALVVSGLAQWLAEVHGLIQGLRAGGVKRVGLLGYSIGSMAAGLAASLWPDLDFVAVMAPVGHHLHGIKQGRVARVLWPWMKTVTPAESALLDRWAPVNRRPLARQLLFLIPLFDELQPTALQQAWRRAWGEPERHEYRHGHISLCFSPRLYRDLNEFAARPGP